MGGKRNPDRTWDDLKYNFSRVSCSSLPSLTKADPFSGGGDRVWGRIQPSTDEVFPISIPGLDETGNGDLCWRQTTQ